MKPMTKSAAAKGEGKLARLVEAEQRTEACADGGLPSIQIASSSAINLAADHTERRLFLIDQFKNGIGCLELPRSAPRWQFHQKGGLN